MEARLLRIALTVIVLLSMGASHRTRNFIVTAQDPQVAVEVAESAESYRRELALEWLGRELPPWQDPCPISVQVGGGAGGVTSFMFDRGRPFGWTMSLQGPKQRILDSVLPHEVTHTIFATHFGRPLPRWADEGACTTVEHSSERDKQQRMLIQFLTTDRGIAFNRMFAMQEYPRDILPLYSQGYSLARFLISQGGKRKFIQYIGEGMRSNDWPRTTRQHYGFADLSELQLTWLDWVRQGSPAIAPDTQLASFDASGDAPAASAASATTPADVGSTAAAADAGPQPASPAGELASNTSSQGSWYARRRDQHQQASTPPAASQSVTRPQEIGRPQQTVLEWSRGQ